MLTPAASSAQDKTGKTAKASKTGKAEEKVGKADGKTGRAAGKSHKGGGKAADRTPKTPKLIYCTACGRDFAHVQWALNHLPKCKETAEGLRLGLPHRLQLFPSQAELFAFGARRRDVLATGQLPALRALLAELPPCDLDQFRNNRPKKKKKPRAHRRRVPSSPSSSSASSSSSSEDEDYAPPRQKPAKGAAPGKQRILPSHPSFMALLGAGKRKAAPSPPRDAAASSSSSSSSLSSSSFSSSSSSAPQPLKGWLDTQDVDAEMSDEDGFTATQRRAEAANKRPRLQGPSALLPLGSDLGCSSSSSSG